MEDKIFPKFIRSMNSGIDPLQNFIRYFDTPGKV